MDALVRPARAAVLISALLRNGPGHLRTVRAEIEWWVDEHEWDSFADVRVQREPPADRNPLRPSGQTSGWL